MHIAENDESVQCRKGRGTGALLIRIRFFGVCYAIYIIRNPKEYILVILETESSVLLLCLALAVKASTRSKMQKPRPCWRNGTSPPSESGLTVKGLGYRVYIGSRV